MGITMTGAHKQDISVVSAHDGEVGPDGISFVVDGAISATVIRTA